MKLKRREFLKKTGCASLAAVMSGVGVARNSFGADETGSLTDAKRKEWLQKWQEHIVAELHSRYCDKEMGEEIGWLVSPFLSGFYYGYRATRDEKWVGYLVDWTNAWLKRAVTEPDGFPGWPKGNGGGNDSSEFKADSLLGEAMALRPVVLMANEIQDTPTLKNKWGAKANEYLALAEKIFEKWDSRDCWREVKDGGLWIVPEFGVDLKTGKWSEGYARRKTAGFSNPDNKENHIARWMLAMHDVTKKKIYRDRAEQWFRLMRSRMRTREDGKYFVWNYWDPAGPWDYKQDGSTRHWVGVHPNGGYYEIDVEGIVAAYEHGLVFTKDDIVRLVATNRDYMWNQQMTGGKFRRIDGGEVDVRWKNSPGVLWNALVPYDATLRKIFVENHDPGSWGGLITTPWFLSLKGADGK